MTREEEIEVVKQMVCDLRRELDDVQAELRAAKVKGSARRQKIQSESFDLLGRLSLTFRDTVGADTETLSQLCDSLAGGLAQAGILLQQMREAVQVERQLASPVVVETDRLDDDDLL